MSRSPLASPSRMKHLWLQLRRCLARSLSLATAQQEEQPMAAVSEEGVEDIMAQFKQLQSA